MCVWTVAVPAVHFFIFPCLTRALENVCIAVLTFSKETSAKQPSFRKKGKLSCDAPTAAYFREKFPQYKRTLLICLTVRGLSPRPLFLRGTAGKQGWIMHYAVDITPCLFKCTSCPLCSGLRGSSAGCEEREKQTYKQKQSQLKGFAPGSTWDTDLKDLCRQRAIITLLQRCKPLHMEIRVLYWFKRPPEKPQCLWLKLTGWPPVTLAPMSTVSISPRWQVHVNSPVQDLNR